MFLPLCFLLEYWIQFDEPLNSFAFLSIYIRNYAIL